MPSDFVAYEDKMQDGRQKLDPALHPKIRALYKTVKSQRKLAEMFGVSRRLIVFILFPERLERLQKHNKEIEHWKLYYSTEERKLAMRKYRAKKRLLKIKPKQYGRTKSI